MRIHFVRLTARPREDRHDHKRMLSEEALALRGFDLFCWVLVNILPHGFQTRSKPLLPLCDQAEFSALQRV